MQQPTGEEWLGLTSDELPVGSAYEWAVRDDCGAVVLFSGTVRDHAEGRAGVEELAYEAYYEVVVQRFAEIASELRRRWPTTGRIVIWHRTGRLVVGESSVVVVVKHHRAEAFEAGRFAIDALKASAPIWKHERWSEGSDWGTGATPIAPARITMIVGIILIIVVVAVIVALVATFVMRRSGPAHDVASFRRQIDALSPEARRPVVDQVQRLEEGTEPTLDEPPPGAEEPIDPDEPEGRARDA